MTTFEVVEIVIDSGDKSIAPPCIDCVADVRAG